MRRARWVRPELVVSVKFQGYTEEGRLRAPVYIGIRHDIAPADCKAAPPEELIEKLEQAAAEPAPEPEPANAGARRVNVAM